VLFDTDIRVQNETRRAFLITRGRLARTFWARFKGLMGHPGLADGEGLILKGEKSIHTFFMRFPIDVVYADRTWQVVHLDPAMMPNRIGPFVFRAAYVLEMPVGAIQTTGTAIGDQLTVQT
jgi:uncharacterized membrane protein (UPF0127 family)